MVLGLIFKGMNEFCGREVTAYDECRAFYSSQYPDGRVRGGECGRQREHLGTCRLLVSDSLVLHCQTEVSALTTAVARKEDSGVLQALTDGLYRCGMTPVPGLGDPTPNRLPKRITDGILRVHEEQRQRAEFVKVVQKQLRQQEELRRGGGIKAEEE